MRNRVAQRGHWKIFPAGIGWDDFRTVWHAGQEKVVAMAARSFQG
jgi:hypothetical protein